MMRVLVALVSLSAVLAHNDVELPPALQMALLQTTGSGPALQATTVSRFFLKGMESLQLVPCSACPPGSQIVEACSVVSDTVCDFFGCTGLEFNPSSARRKASSVFQSAAVGADCNAPRLDAEGGWCASVANNVPNEWMQIDLGIPMPVSHVILQTRKTAPSQRFVKFKIQYGNTESSLQDLENGKIFDGIQTDDANIRLTQKFAQVVLARFWRIIPTQINGHMSGRWGLGVCATPTSCVPVLLNPDNSKRKYSSFNTGDPYRTAVLDDTQGWLAQQPNNVPNDFTTIELPQPERIGAAIVQPRKDAPQHRVVKFRVQYSQDDQTYFDIDNGKIFDGIQFDRDEKVLAEFDTPVRAKFWKIIPTQINGHMGLRWALGKCA
eukprot:c1374_g1_i1.p1 GENE.c1374_g1_i1~~c1374_g1_i1.p1  ORF type:complete len:380 (+),score=111.86 c1374_g1_i1:1280-2419(+)